MSETPAQIVRQWLDDDKDLRIPDTEWGRRLYDALRAVLATVTPNPDDAAQVEVVARALFDRSVEVAFGATWHGQPEGVREAFRMDARAVLAALAEAVGG